jgi:uncharacterized C2H2 Zn-finger protein
MSSIIQIKCDRCGEVFIRPVVYSKGDDDQVSMTNIEMTNWGSEDYEQIIAEICPKCDSIVRHEFELFLLRAGILKP